MEIIKFEELENKLIKYQDKYVLVDKDVAELVENFHRFNNLKHSTVNFSLA